MSGQIAQAKLTSGVMDVIQNGYCVGCGACAVVDHRVQMVFDDRKVHQAIVKSAIGEGDPANIVCPFSSKSANETVIGEALYGDKALSFDKRAGYYSKIYAGQISDDQRILGSSSGGLTTWLLSKLLETGMIDGVVHVGGADEEGMLFEYRVSRTTKELTSGRKSQYYSVNLAETIHNILGDGKKYAFVGVPCFIRAIRLIGNADQVFEQQIAFTVGLVCGHMKSGAFAEVMSYQVGVEPDDLSTVDFRVKNSAASSNSYDFGAKRASDASWSKAMSREMVGGNWGHALFQLKACDYCDDIFAETADVCFGDAWLPRYEKDWRGTNIVVTRNRAIDDLLTAGATELHLEPLTIQDAVDTQGGNFRHRWDGLSVRLQDAVDAGVTVPLKRIAPGSIVVSGLRKKIVRARQKIAERSHVAYLESRRTGKIDAFFSEMRPMISGMEKLYGYQKYSSVRFWIRLPFRLVKRLVRMALGRAPRAS